MSTKQSAQYDIIKEHLKDHKLNTLGSMISHAWDDDPKRLAFTFSRYKFVSKMLDGSKNVLEVGCGDGFASRVVLQHVENLSLCDINNIDELRAVNPNQLKKWQFKDIIEHNFITDGPLADGKYDGIYSLDVLEHIDKQYEDSFLKNIVDSLLTNGVLIIGMPTIESQVYASPISKLEHVNCKNLTELKNVMLEYFNNVFMFSMNDEVLHTGYEKMSHYVFAVCCNKK